MITENNIPEIDRDNPEEIAKYAVSVLDSRKATDIKMYHVADQTIITDYVVLCCGNSRTQIKALTDETEYRLGLCKIKPLHIEGEAQGGWMLIDFGSVIVHVFSESARKSYDLDKLYKDTEEVDISSQITEE